MIKFQVIILDERDYILEYKDFKLSELEDMSEYIKYQCTRIPCKIVKITKWDELKSMLKM